MLAEYVADRQLTEHDKEKDLRKPFQSLCSAASPSKAGNSKHDARSSCARGLGSSRARAPLLRKALSGQDAAWGAQLLTRLRRPRRCCSNALNQEAKHAARHGHFNWGQLWKVSVSTGTARAHHHDQGWNRSFRELETPRHHPPKDTCSPSVGAGGLTKQPSQASYTHIFNKGPISLPPSNRGKWEKKRVLSCTLTPPPPSLCGLIP